MYAATASMHAGIRARVRRQRRASLASILRMQMACAYCDLDKEPADFKKAGNGNLRDKCKACCNAYEKLSKQDLAAKRASAPDELELCRACRVPKPAAKMSWGLFTVRKSCYNAAQLSELGKSIVSRLANRLGRAGAAQGATRAGPVRGMFGCSVKELVERFVALQYDGMEIGRDWADVHIDHIRPCSDFDLRDPKEQMCCFNHKNMQVLWPRDNLLKGDSEHNIRSFKMINDRAVIEVQLATACRITGTVVIEAPASKMCTCILGACTVHRAAK